MNYKIALRPLLITILLLLFPLYGEFYIDGWNWGPMGFVAAFVMIFSTLLIWELITRKSTSKFYKTGVGLAMFGCFAIIWWNLAVGFIGWEDNPINILFFLIVLIALGWGIVAKFNSKWSERAMYVTAAAQFVAPIIGLLMWQGATTFREGGAIEILTRNLFFVLIWIMAALCFRYAAKGK